MKKLLWVLVAIALMTPSMSYAEKVMKPVNKATMMPIGGGDITGEAQILRVNPDGSLNVAVNLEPGMPFAIVTSGVVEINDVDPDERVQMPALAASACTLMAYSENDGNVYVGGATVTNAAGVAVGLALAPLSAISNISLNNLNIVYVASDVAGNKISYLCN